MRRRHRGSSLFYEAEISGSVSAGGQVTSTGFVTGGPGWAIDGDGNVEFNSGTFRGALDAATGSFAGSLSAATGTFAGSLSAATGTFAGDISAATGTFAGALDAATGTFAGDISAASGTFTGNISGGTIDIGGADATSFHVDATGRMWLGAALFDDGQFRVTAGGALTASGVTATGTIRTAASGTRIEMGNNGNDQITFHDATKAHPGYLEVTAGEIRLAAPSPTADTLVAYFGENGAVVGGASGLEVFGPNTAVVSLTAVGRTYLTGNGIFIFPNQASAPAPGRLHLGAGSGYAGNASQHGANIFPSFVGLFYDQLQSAYMIMSDGTGTFVGADAGIYLRPFGNAGGEVSIFRSSAGVIQVRGPNGLINQPTFTFTNDTDTGMWLGGAGDLRFSGNGVLRFRIDSTLGVQAYHRFFLSGLGSSSSTSGEPLWHFNGGGDEIYEYTSTGKLKGNQRDRSRSEARSILNLRPKTFDAKMSQRDGTIIDLATDEVRRDPKKKGQIYDMVGLIAEDVAVDFPDACIYDEAGEPRNIDWNAITTSIIGLLQDMDERLDALEKS